MVWVEEAPAARGYKLLGRNPPIPTRLDELPLIVLITSSSDLHRVKTFLHLPISHCKYTLILT